ncbi:MAG TPA: phospholipase D-like domain-containing protein [Verrucomicrobiae bacterium]|nr:phospholipase D-like domain-containing protein [Verrucomicrobiae bacterium]
MTATAVAIIGAFLATIIGINLKGGEKQIRYHLDQRLDVSTPAFIDSMGHLLGPQLLSGNEITAYQNGDQIFPPMLEAMRAAQKTITFETYIYWEGQIGRAFTDTLCDRARSNVKVHVLMDWVGTDRIDKTYLEEMRRAGVQVERFHPPRWYNLSKLNNRTHRKLLVVDGKVGFTGGVGIADPWLGNADRTDHWRDSHYRIRGPAVAQMQAVFNDNWIKARAEALYGSDYFPKLEPAGDSLAQVFHSSKGEGSESVRLMYLLSIASARKHIRLAASYFVPDSLAIQTLVAARKRGVKVEIIMAGEKTDAPAVRSASRSRWQDLLNAGVEIYEYGPCRYHCKVMIVDDVWVSVGSTNFDDRSFRQNDEANLNIYDPKFAAEQVVFFEQDRNNSKLVRLQDFKKRPLMTKIKDWTTGAFGSQL